MGSKVTKDPKAIDCVLVAIVIVANPDHGVVAVAICTPKLRIHHNHAGRLLSATATSGCASSPDCPITPFAIDPGIGAGFHATGLGAFEAAHALCATVLRVSEDLAKDSLVPPPQDLEQSDQLIHSLQRQSTADSGQGTELHFCSRQGDPAALMTTVHWEGLYCAEARLDAASTGL
eukprot:CAMPEP_0206456042 /NCGR_PEP_ID=MMETSP0324_2-20121206/22134_1 /ASSEMBLY_ACC=CAM_ASM_000836 /TAXON_ID=2866 /ORGANISM="Crypthecodinium cohnii, Strain Seligo" /LENGTH=175 /DNA_ID=CAMNT_0053926905 /DNA_START=612 /DNA_END=1140 /DNA_ORIENTATION=-